MPQTTNLVLAVDGGQTHSLAIISDKDGHVLGAGSGGPANHYLESGGPVRFRTAMSDSIHAALNAAQASLQPVLASYYCLTGVHEDMTRVLQQIAPSQKQTVTGDAEASLAGATLQRPAVLVLAGTGSIAYGVDQQGHKAIAGGWGYAMGDEGSATWIANQALSVATRAADGRGIDTALTFLIPQHFHVADLKMLHTLIYTHQIDRVALAGIAKIVSQAAADGDIAAQEVMAQAVRYLADSAVTILSKLQLASQRVPVTTAGGVFKSGSVFSQAMMLSIQTEYPLAYYLQPKYPPIIGALFLAMQSIGIRVDSLIQDNVNASAEIWKSRK